MRIWTYLLASYAVAASAALDASFILAYFEYKYVDYGSVYGCFGSQEKINLGKEVMMTNFSVSLFDVDVENFNLSKTNIVTEHNRRLGVVLDGNCRNADAVIAQASELQVFSEVHYWLVFLDSNTITERFETALLTISSDLMVAVPADGGDGGYDLFEVYNQAAKHNGSLMVNEYEKYISGQPFQRTRLWQHKYWLRRNMTGVVFKAMVVLPRHFDGTLDEYLVNEDHREINTFNRFHAVLVYHIMDYYNFKMDLSWTKSWGYKMQNNTFDGMVRALQDRVVDFGLSPLFVKEERFPAIDYGRRSWILRSAFIFRRPKRPASFEAFFRPLDYKVWIVTIPAILVIVFLLRVAMKTEYGYLKSVLNSFESTWSFLLLFTFGAICQQGATDTPNSICGRILVLYIFIFSVLLYQFYSASIVAILLAAPARIIKDLSDLAHSQLSLGVEDVLYNRDYIWKLEYDPVVSLLERKAPKGRTNVSFYCDPEVCMPLVRKGGYAFHVEVATAYPIIEETFTEDEICDLDEVQLFQTQQMHQVLEKGSPFREMLNYVLQRIDEAGLMYRQLKHWLARKPECIRSRPKTDSVSIEEFYPALAFLFIGIMVSVTIMVLEHVVHLRMQKYYEEREKKRVKQFLRAEYDDKDNK